MIQYRLRRWLTVLLLLGSLQGAAAAQDLQVQPQPDPDFYADDDRLAAHVREAIERNPKLQKALARYRAALQKVPQVTALPDPMLGFQQYIRGVETRVGPQLNAFTLSQKLPWFGKLELNGKVALKEAAAQYHNYRSQQREVIARVKRAFYELSYVDGALEITREEQSLLEHYEALAQARYASGQGLQQSVIKIQAEITRILDRLQILGRHRETLAAQLNTLMDRAPERPLPPVGRMSLPSPALTLQELYALGEQSSPELRAAMAGIERSEQSIELASKDYWPDLTIGAGLVNVTGRDDPAALLMPPRDDGKNALSFSVSLNLPIRRRKYDARVLQATETLIADRQEYRERRNDMEFSIREQVVRLETLRGQMDLFDRVLIPQAEEALRASESAYETGQLGALDLLDSERVLLEIRLVDARYHADYLRALAELERALGTRFPR